jgi:hypothetical protein
MALDPRLPQRPFRALLGGAAAGMAYLGKAYMLPFTLVHLPVTLLMHWWISRRSGQAAACNFRAWGITWIAFLVGQAVIAAPWVVVLTSHYGKLTMSTAGSSNHANMSPKAFGNDPLWNPGLVADFIADPRLVPDWSPLQDAEHFLQQLKVIVYNLNSCISYVLPWAVFGGIFAAARRGNRHRPSGKVAADEGFPGFWWCVVTISLYCGGYSFINLESRYIVPVITPLLCLGATLVVFSSAPSSEGRLDWIRARGRQSAWCLIPVILLVSCQDVHRLVCTPLIHPQSVSLARYHSIAEQLRRDHFLPNPFAANEWHQGLTISYAADDVPDYLGAPLPDSATSMMEQLQSSSAVVYLRWCGPKNSDPQGAMVDAFVPAAPWTLVSTIQGIGSGPAIEVYARR